MTSTRRPWVGPAVLVVLGVFALLGGAGLLHVLLVMTGLWWLLTRTGSRGRHAAPYSAPVQAPPMRRSPTPPVSDAAYWPVLPAAAGAAAAWYATRDKEPDVTGSDEEGDEGACADDFGGSGGGGAWGEDFGGYGGGDSWGDDFGAHGGGGWDDD